MDKEYLETAAVAYLRLLASKGANADTLAQRRRVLDRLLPGLVTVPLRSDAYRHAVDALLAQLAGDDAPGVLTVVREYYYFWLGDVAQLAEVHARSGFVVRDVRLGVVSIDELRRRMEASGFTDYPPSLEIYLDHLYEGGLSADELAAREALLKPLLYMLHAHPHDPDIYRSVVDHILLGLHGESRAKAFLALARDFFYYWHNFPRADRRQIVET